ncbi:MAG: hypothetical protein DRP78_06490 [Candidatus Omnitrophota bacterium]|nr:MAG: hypothetical protein DRP78_06490 [Candidatus Omnitrophota bacterium]
MLKRGFFVSALFLLVIVESAFSAPNLKKTIDAGNKLYAAGKYDAALLKYSDAQIQAPLRPEVLFNMGNVFYRQKKYKESIDCFQKSMEKGDRLLEAKAFYNIGNTFFNQGRLQEALESYKQALERDPEDIDTKYNIEYTEQKIKEMLSQSEKTKSEAEQQRSKQQQDRKNSEDKNQDKKEKQMKANEPQHQSKDQQQAKAAQTGQDKEQKMEQGKEKENEKENKNDDKEKQANKIKGELTKQEAERFLSAFEQEQENLPLNQKSQQIRSTYIEKDW